MANKQFLNNFRNYYTDDSLLGKDIIDHSVSVDGELNSYRSLPTILSVNREELSGDEGDSNLSLIQDKQNVNEETSKGTKRPLSPELDEPKKHKKHIIDITQVRKDIITSVYSIIFPNNEIKELLVEEAIKQML